MRPVYKIIENHFLDINGISCITKMDYDEDNPDIKYDIIMNTGINLHTSFHEIELLLHHIKEAGEVFLSKEGERRLVYSADKDRITRREREKLKRELKLLNKNIKTSELGNLFVIVMPSSALDKVMNLLSETPGMPTFHHYIEIEELVN